ncbi:unnamed protein product [Cuscuta epithymum]|uniref:Uncharacterized protein n=1 Tax=Cuscuta epithymum TaxID=186058 RepID=A0AAV0G6V6_9ASTE|nr:unnamed protein product [Cuscuta epithymum]
MENRFVHYYICKSNSRGSS